MQCSMEVSAVRYARALEACYYELRSHHNQTPNFFYTSQYSQVEAARRAVQMLRLFYALENALFQLSLWRSPTCRENTCSTRKDLQNATTTERHVHC